MSYQRALVWACEEGELAVVKLLLANGAEPNERSLNACYSKQACKDSTHIT